MKKAVNKKSFLNLDKNQFNILNQIIKQHVPNKTIWAYGSRVNGKPRDRSDLDLVIFDCDPVQIMNFETILEESHLLISVDVMDWKKIPHSFKKDIKNNYVVLQKKIHG